MQISTNAIVGGIFGAVLVFYLIGSVFNDASAQLDAVNSSYKGANLIKLLPLIFAMGIVVAMYYLFTAKNR